MIPTEIYYLIFSFIKHPTDLFKIAQTCVTFSDIVNLLIDDHESFASTLISFFKRTGSSLIQGDSIINHHNILCAYIQNEPEPLIISISDSLKLYKNSECFCQHDYKNRELHFIYLSRTWIPNTFVSLFIFTKLLPIDKLKISYLEYLNNSTYSALLKYHKSYFHLLPTHNSKDLITIFYDGKCDTNMFHQYYVFHNNHPDIVISIASNLLLRLKSYQECNMITQFEFYFTFWGCLCFLKFAIDYSSKNIISDFDLKPTCFRTYDLKYPVFVHQKKFYSFNHSGMFLLKPEFPNDQILYGKSSDYLNISFL